jgi:Protein of unknown function (DUF2490)
MKLHISILIIFVISTSQLFAQTSPNFNIKSNTNAWLMYFGDHKFSNKWGVHLESQVRRNDLLKNPQQFLFRTGLNYHISPTAFATVGYCFVQTAVYGVFPSQVAFPEHRFWEQLQIKNQVGRLECINRLRLEQRFVNLPSYNSSTAVYEVGDAVYTNRARILNRVSIPFKGKTIVDKSIYVSVYDEVFANFGKNIGKNIFDQNRAYAALGYKLPKYGKLELGYLHQSILKSDGIRIERNQTLQVGFLSTMDFYKSGK